MAFNLTSQIKNNESLPVNVVFYFICAAFFAIVFSYFVFTFKVYFETQKINEIDSRIFDFNSEQQRLSEKKVLDYEKKIDDYSFIIKNHRIFSNVFDFIEEKTLPNVWFSSFDMSSSANEIKLLGESENAETLVLQVAAFEGSKDYVKDISVLNSEVQSSGRVRFNLSFHLNPQIFVYKGI